MALEGDLRLFALPDILQVVSQQQKTGILTVQGEQDILAVSFLRGEIVAADALNQNFEDALGEVLASQGVIAPQEFARLLEEHRTSGERLSELLVRRGVLSREQLLEALRLQTYRLLLQVLRWREGDFKFYSGEEVSYEAGVLPISVEEVLLRSIGDLMGEGTMSGTLPHGFVAYERADWGRRVRVGGWQEEAEASDPSIVWITPDEQVVLDRLDGRTVAQALAEETGLGDYKTLYALYRLLKAGLVRPVGEPPPAAPPPEPERRVELESTASGAHPAPAFEPAATATIVRPAVVSDPFAAARGARLGSIVALAAALLLPLFATMRPVATVLPFPGQHEAREAFARQRRLARLEAIDRAARTVYQVEGSYPPSLEDLIQRGLLPGRMASDAEGRELRLVPEEQTYRLEALAGEQEPERVQTEGVAGDFLLDPAFFADLREEVDVPLVLLD